MSDGETAGTEDEAVDHIAADEANQSTDDGEWMNTSSSEEGASDEAAEGAGEPAEVATKEDDVEPVEAAAEVEDSVEEEPEAEPAAVAPAPAAPPPPEASGLAAFVLNNRSWLNAVSWLMMLYAAWAVVEVLSNTWLHGLQGLSLVETGTPTNIDPTDLQRNNAGWVIGTGAVGGLIGLGIQYIYQGAPIVDASMRTTASLILEQTMNAQARDEEIIAKAEQAAAAAATAAAEAAAEAAATAATEAATIAAAEAATAAATEIARETAEDTLVDMLEASNDEDLVEEEEVEEAEAEHDEAASEETDVAEETSEPETESEGGIDEAEAEPEAEEASESGEKSAEEAPEVTGDPVVEVAEEGAEETAESEAPAPSADEGEESKEDEPAVRVSEDASPDEEVVEEEEEEPSNKARKF